ncbi:hypothetical protein G7084_01920 [Weissella coleopterorum]|uniref:SAM-dependent methyltransferase n=1 Tax=Weissella coleopterorum TaxID=2714949 RepID=A0A6G8AYZ9_9LACO|nr:hypothetical protein [Weissella coleopterorum]QIL50189.1 hypothetical protein G7084_01920 [Weissella coleopterorum]
MQQVKISPAIKLADSAYFQQIKDYQRQFKQIPLIMDYLAQILEVEMALQAGQLPPQLPFLEINEAMIEAVQRRIVGQYPNQPILGNKIWGQQVEALMGLDQLLHDFRDELIQRYKMYGYVSTPAVTELSNYLTGRKTLELMAGYGYLSAGLKSLQPDQWIHAVDNESWQFQPNQSALKPQPLVEKMDALSALAHYGNEFEVLLVSWSPDADPVDLSILTWVREHFQGEFLLIGEDNGATNSPAFWQTADLTPIDTYNQKFGSFDLIDEKLYRVK